MENNDDLKSWKKIGYSYLYGKDVEKDYLMALKWYTKAAELGDKDSQIRIAKLYYYCNAIEEDFEKSEYWFRKAIEESKLGLKFYDIGKELSDKLYYSGKGKNGGHVHAFRPEKSIYWFKKSAKLGNSDAMFKLGTGFLEGEGVDKNLKQSFHWLNKAVENNCSERIRALILIASFYEEGLVCSQDTDRAFFFYNKALATCNNEIESYAGLPAFYLDIDHLNYLHSCIQEINEQKLRAERNKIARTQAKELEARNEKIRQEAKNKLKEEKRLEEEEKRERIQEEKKLNSANNMTYLETIVFGTFAILLYILAQFVKILLNIYLFIFSKKKY